MYGSLKNNLKKHKDSEHRNILDEKSSIGSKVFSKFHNSDCRCRLLLNTCFNEVHFFIRNYAFEHIKISKIFKLSSVHLNFLAFSFHS